MKKTLIVTYLLLISAVCFCQQVISDNALSTQRHRRSTSRAPLVYAPGAESVQSASGDMTYAPSFHVNPLPSVSNKSGQMASEIYAPFQEDVSSMSRRREGGWGLPDPGERDPLSPVGSEWIMLLFAAASLAASYRKHKGTSKN